MHFQKANKTKQNRESQRHREHATQCLEVMGLRRESFAEEVRLKTD